MSVLDRRYHRWPGAPTSYLTRALVIPRYALGDLARRRVVVALWCVALLPSVALALLTYVAANLDVLSQSAPWLTQFSPSQIVGAEVFSSACRFQVQISIVLALFAGPRLIAQDMAGGAIPLFLSKAIRRSDYIAAKCSVLLGVLSSVSWMPLLLVVGLRTALGLPDVPGISLAWAVTVVPLAFVSFLTVLTCAISAHVRRTWLAPFLLLGVLYTTAAMGATMNAISKTRVGTLASPLLLTRSLHASVFEPEGLTSSPRDPEDRPLPAPVALAGLAAWTAGCGWLLARRVRSVEVVR